MIRKEIARLETPALLDISIDTVERYQGSQRDVIIYSFTIRNFSQLNFLTANTFREGDFLIDRKLNVAITRARKQLILTGNPQVLGSHITFYKLMEYIRMRNGYIETNTDDFCSGRFDIPDYTAGWDLNPAVYPLPDAFRQVFTEIVEQPFQELNNRQDEVYHREITAYGRCTFRSEAALSAPADYALLYNHYYMPRQYAAARSLWAVSYTHLTLPTNSLV